MVLPVGHVVPWNGEHGPIDVHRVGEDMVMVVQVRAGDLNSRAVALDGSRVSGKQRGVTERLSEIRLLVREKVIGGEMVGKLGNGLFSVKRRVLMNAWGSLIGAMVGGDARVISYKNKQTGKHIISHFTMFWLCEYSIITN